VCIIFGAVLLGIQGVTKVVVLDRLFGKNALLSRVLFCLIGISAVSVAFHRDTYLPFLGETILPSSVLGTQVPPGATHSVQVRVEPDAKVVFWASEPGDGQGTWQTAYRDYQNAGVGVADSTGMATLKVREPQGYSVPMKGHLEPHVHFRVCRKDGFIGPIKTVYLADGRVEGFVGGY
jgi:hypothetical protein